MTFLFPYSSVIPKALVVLKLSAPYYVPTRPFNYTDRPWELKDRKKVMFEKTNHVFIGMFIDSFVKFMYIKYF